MSVENQPVKKKGRIESIDVFRGLTIFVMIFVNDLASVKGIPAWMEHMPANADGMTFVDVVFPAFLFIVGMAIPFALNKRIAKGDKLPGLIKHILSRTSALLILGVMMVNIGGLNSSVVGMSHSLWMLLLFIGAIMAWNLYPQAEGRRKAVYKILQYLGVALLIYLAVIYRRGEPGNLSWFHTQWWGILGLIGWAYFFSSLVYLVFKNNLPGLIGMMIFFVLLYIGDKSGALGSFYTNNIKDYFWLGGHIGAHTAITISGIIISTLFIGESKASTPNEKIRWMIIFALFAYAGGFFLRPLYGISKIYATPSWTLYSVSICTLLYAFLYWLIDLKGVVKWSRFLKPAGSNPLLAYLLPDIFYALIWMFGINIMSEYFGYGIVGIIRSLVFSLIMLWFTARLTKLGVKLHL